MIRCSSGDVAVTVLDGGAVWLEGGERNVGFLSDVERLETLASKKRLLPRAAREGWILVFGHDADLPVGVLDEKGGELSVRPFEPEA